jgi:hypothetical protein
VGAGELTGTVIIPSVAGPAIAAISAALARRGQPPPEITIEVTSFPQLDVLAKQPASRKALHH